MLYEYGTAPKQPCSIGSQELPGFPIGVHAIVTADPDDAITSDRSPKRNSSVPMTPPDYWALAVRQRARPSNPANKSRPVPGWGRIATRKAWSGTSGG